MSFDVRMPKQTPEQKEAAQERRMQGLKDEMLKEQLERGKNAGSLSIFYWRT